MNKIICAPMRSNFEVPTETKINHQLITNQTKIKLYPLDNAYIFLTRGSVRRI